MAGQLYPNTPRAIPVQLAFAPAGKAPPAESFEIVQNHSPVLLVWLLVPSEAAAGHGYLFKFKPCRHMGEWRGRSVPGVRSSMTKTPLSLARRIRKQLGLISWCWRENR